MSASSPRGVSPEVGRVDQPDETPDADVWWEGIKPRSQASGIVHLTTTEVRNDPMPDCRTKCGLRGQTLLPLRFNSDGDRYCERCVRAG